MTSAEMADGPTFVITTGIEKKTRNAMVGAAVGHKVVRRANPFITEPMFLGIDQLELVWDHFLQC